MILIIGKDIKFKIHIAEARSQVGEDGRGRHPDRPLHLGGVRGRGGRHRKGERDGELRRIDMVDKELASHSRGQGSNPAETRC